MYEHDSYLLAFIDSGGDVYDVHICDDLHSSGTFEYVEFKYSLPYAHYIVIWRRDHKKITRKNADVIFKYIKDDMEEFMMEDEGEKNAWHVHIRRKLTRDHDCLVLAWDKMSLPKSFPTWPEFLSWAYMIVEENSSVIAEPNSIHDRELAIYDGRMFPK